MTTKPNRDEQPWLATASGQKLRPGSVNPEQVEIEDIAHGLAHAFRFGGQSPKGYTVAQHSVEVSRQVPEKDALWGLLHDAAEAYLCDVPRPIKRHMHLCITIGTNTGERFALVPFEVVEEDTLHAVITRFDLLWPMPKSVAWADDRELARERRDLFDERQPEWPDLTAAPNPRPILTCWDPAEAERLFMERFRELGEGLGARD